MLTRSRDLDAARARLTPWLATKLPGATGVEISALRLPGAGLSNETYLAEAAWREGRARREAALVLRLDPCELAVFPAYDLLLQCRILRSLAGTGIPVPTVRWVEEDPAVIGCRFYVMDRIDGEIPSDMPPYHVAGWCVDATPARRARLWWAGLEVLARIHRLDWRRLGFDVLGVPPADASALDPQLDYYADFLRDVEGDAPQPILRAALAWLRAHRYAPERITLCWGDSRLPNMIFRDDDVVGVLDWEMAFLGDPEADLAWWIYIDQANSEGYGFPRLAGFPGPEETIARYEALVGRPVQHARYHEIFAAFRFGVIMARVAGNLVAAGIPVGMPDLATNNPCTRHLATRLGLPAPGPAPAASGAAG